MAVKRIDEYTPEVVQAGDQALGVRNNGSPTTVLLQVGDALDAVGDALDAKLNNDDPSVTNAREWTASAVGQEEAEAGTATTRRAWTAQRVFQAIAAWVAANLGNAAERTVGTSAENQIPDRAAADARYLIQSNNLSDLGNAGTARANLGLENGATTEIFASEDEPTSGDGVNGDIWLRYE